MKLTANKGVIVIEGREGERAKIEEVAARMVDIDDELVGDSEGVECGEYWLTLGYNPSYLTVKEVRQIYKTAKK